MAIGDFSAGDSTSVRSGAPAPYRPAGSRSETLPGAANIRYRQDAPVPGSPSAGPCREGIPMTLKKTLHQRERELQALLATPDGRKELQALVSRYQAAG